MVDVDGTVVVFGVEDHVVVLALHDGWVAAAGRK
jgi:hypothetical protein